MGVLDMNNNYDASESSINVGQLLGSPPKHLWHEEKGLCVICGLNKRASFSCISNIKYDSFSNAKIAKTQF